jgi:hypothetical protein
LLFSRNEALRCQAETNELGPWASHIAASGDAAYKAKSRIDLASQALAFRAEYEMAGGTRKSEYKKRDQAGSCSGDTLTAYRPSSRSNGLSIK